MTEASFDAMYAADSAVMALQGRPATDADKTRAAVNAALPVELEKARQQWERDARKRLEDPETAWRFRAQMPPAARGSTINTIVALRAVADLIFPELAEPEERRTLQRWSGVANIAWCPEHGLHGARDTCFECGRPVEQIPMVPVWAAAFAATWADSGEGEQ